jgi:excinuclease UvrABC helicase subunit UvrB
MFDLFGKRKSLKEIMNELDEMIGSFNHEFSSITDEESQSNEGSDKNGEWKTETYTSPNGMFRYVITTTHRTPDKKYPKESSELTLLRKELESSIETQEFEKACELRDKIQKIELNMDKITELQSQLDKSIKEQDFETSIKLRDKLNKMKS